MTNLADEFPFLKDPGLEPEQKKILLEKSFEERIRQEQVADRRAADKLEKLKFWNNTPLVVALVGLITIGANAWIGYIQGNQKSSLQETAATAEAARAASKEEREFAYKIVESELAKSSDTQGRATVLLFLVRAGVLNSLNRTELQQMALADLSGTKNQGGQTNIPATLGRVPPINVCVGNGGGAACLGPGAVTYTCAEYAEIGGGSDLTYDTFNKRFCQGKGDAKTNVRHNFSVGGGQCGWTSFTVNCPS